MNPSRNVAILIFDEGEVLDFCGPFSEKMADGFRERYAKDVTKKVTKVESV